MTDTVWKENAVNTIKIMFIIAIAGHLLCGYTDCLMTYLPKGRFRFTDMKDNQKLSAVFEGMPQKNALMAMLLGCLAMCMLFFGYIALCQWMRQYSEVCAALMLAGSAMIFTFGMAHHILCGVPEWLYVRLGRTENARQIISELFRKTSVTLIVCYLGFLLFGAALFTAVVSGWTPLPAWACVINILPMMLVLFPTRIGGAGNWAGAIMFIGLLFLI